MGRTQIILGPPGTGKTTKLLHIIEAAIQEGIPPHRIACLTFTKKAAEELINRACEKFGLTPKSFPLIRTLHSLAFRQMGITKERVMDTEMFTTFGEDTGGYDFTRDYDENIERLPRGGGIGDRCMALYSLHKAKQIPLEDIWLINQNGVDWPTFKYFAACLERFKSTYHVYDFTDFCDVKAPPLDVSIFIIDEAQDLTTQQWGYASRAAKTANKVYIAGDDDQAIFQWAGADVNKLFRLKGKVTVLPKSWRLPRKIYDLANHISSGIKHRYPKEWSPRDEEGAVNYFGGADQVDMKEGTWFFLARHQYQLDFAETLVRQAGLAYTIGKRSSVGDDEIRAALAYEMVRGGGRISSRQAQLIRKFMSFMLVPPDKEFLDWENIKFAFDGKPDWMQALDLMGDNHRDYIRLLRSNGESLTAQPRIHISTIHGVKGGEMDHVLLMPGMSPKSFNAMDDDMDQELRVWYTAITRAMYSLNIVLPTGRRYINSLFY